MKNGGALLTVHSVFLLILIHLVIICTVAADLWCCLGSTSTDHTSDDYYYMSTNISDANAIGVGLASSHENPVDCNDLCRSDTIHQLSAENTSGSGCGVIDSSGANDSSVGCYDSGGANDSSAGCFDSGGATDSSAGCYDSGGGCSSGGGGDCGGGND